MCLQARRRAREGVAALARHVAEVAERVGPGLNLTLVVHDTLLSGGAGRIATSDLASQPLDRLLVVAPGGRRCLEHSLRQVLARAVGDTPAENTTTTVLTNGTEIEAHFQRQSRKPTSRPLSDSLLPEPGTAVHYRGIVVHRCTGASRLIAAQPARQPIREL